MSHRTEFPLVSHLSARNIKCRHHRGPAAGKQAGTAHDVRRTSANSVPGPACTAPAGAISSLRSTGGGTLAGRSTEHRLSRICPCAVGSTLCCGHAPWETMARAWNADLSDVALLLAEATDVGFMSRVKEPGRTRPLWHLHAILQLLQAEGNRGGTPGRSGHGASEHRVASVSRRVRPIRATPFGLYRARGKSPQTHPLAFARCTIVLTTFSGVVSHPLAGGTGLDAVQVGRATRPSPEARGREREGLALRHAVHSPADRKADRPRQRPFFLGIRHPHAPKRRPAGDIRSRSC